MTSDTAFNDRTLSLGLARVAEQAALACADLIGRGDEKAADQAAVNAMRDQLNMLAIKGVVVIGEGERDEAPMLFIGEEVGTGDGPGVDIALDPLEGTTLTAKAMPNALTVIAMAPRGTLLHAPDTYMDKLAIGPGYPEGVVSLAMSPRERVEALAKARGCRPSEITVCVLERPRHQEMIAELRETGAAVYLITDFDRVYARDEMVTSDVIFAATGVTDGSIVKGVQRRPGFVETETVLMRSRTGSVRRMIYRSKRD
jgi:fructose-1,6-bisphosphatase II / sedoheptulose-1,7-bisphosphatase